jgi:16S rRNA (guanine966-N2)-methyltransferase
MRIIAGKIGGQNFDSPRNGRTHPMSDKIRGGLFNSLGDLSGLSVLDTFAGSGALSFEAISRGASEAVAIEADNTAYNAIKGNVKTLKLDSEVKATKAYLKSWLNRKRNMIFDLILVDPPYDDIPYKSIRLLPDHLSDGGTLVLSWPGNQDPLTLSTLEIVRKKNYGDAQLVFYKKIS